MALEEFVLAAGVPLAGGLVLSWALEACLSLRPRPPWRRPASALFLHAGLWMLAFALAWAVVRRPYFAAALALAGAGLIVVVNNAKYQALREPFVWADFEYFWTRCAIPGCICRSWACGGRWARRRAWARPWPQA
ncbi:hypothetical protein WJ976_07575 [Achromobacter denitrificans]